MAKENNLASAGIIQFSIPVFLFGLSYYLLPWSITLALFVSILLLVKREYLLTSYLWLSFYNIMQLKDIPFWASLITSFIALIIIVMRIGTIKRKVPPLLLIPLLVILLIVISFLTRTLGEYYFLTGVKSSIQLLFLLFTIIILTCIPEHFKLTSKAFFDKYFLRFIIFYLLSSLAFYDFKERFGGATGPQCLALQLSLVLCYFYDLNPRKRVLQLFLLVIIFVTGSRTYFISSFLLLIYDYFKSSSLRIKLIVLTNAVAISALMLFLLPFSDTRFNYTSSKFWGTFVGRYMYYENAIKMITDHPVAGNGMGSILVILEHWTSKAGFRYYKLNGDTTIVHNEYLRIIIELGFLGFIIAISGVVLLWRKLATAGKYILLIFLVGSLMENTLTLYTTGTLTLMLLLAFTNAANRQADREKHTA